MGEIDRYDFGLLNKTVMQQWSLHLTFYSSDSCQKHVMIPNLQEWVLKVIIMSDPINKYTMIGVDVAKLKLDVASDDKKESMLIRFIYHPNWTHF